MVNPPAVQLVDVLKIVFPPIVTPPRAPSADGQVRESEVRVTVVNPLFVSGSVTAFLAVVTVPAVTVVKVDTYHLATSVSVTFGVPRAVPVASDGVPTIVAVLV